MSSYCCVAAFAVYMLAAWEVCSGLRNGLNGVHFFVSAHDVCTNLSIHMSPYNNLNISIFKLPPFQFLNWWNNGSVIYSGSTPNIIYWIAEKFNMRYN